MDFLPFDPTIKRTEGTLKGPDGRTFKCTKGAPHIILKLVEIDQEEVAKRVNWKVCAVVYAMLRLAHGLLGAPIDVVVQGCVKRAGAAMLVPAAAVAASSLWLLGVELQNLAVLDPPSHASCCCCCR